MASIPLLTSAAIAALTVLVTAFILVPEPLWTATTIATAIGFAGSVCFMFLPLSLSALRRNAQSTDASQMAAVGPLGTVSLVLLLATGGGFVLALNGYQNWGLALLVFGVGAFLVMSIVLSAALKVVGDVSAKWSQPSHHVDWRDQVTTLASQSTHQESLATLHALLEQLRYATSDVPGGSPQDAGIEHTFNVMSETLQSDPAADLTSHFGGIKGLLVQRDVFLRSARRKA